jgi:hypothetical protein
MSAEELAEVERHLGECGECGAEADSYARLRREMRSMAPRRVPEPLSSHLLIMARQERRRRESRRQFVRHWIDRVQLVFENLMRPLAVPALGGLTSAVVLFGTLVPRLNTPRIVQVDDVQTPIYQEASVYTVPEFVSKVKADDNALIEVEVDANGRVIDYTLPEGTMTSELGNMILFTTYQPAKLFGLPATGGKIVLRRSRIVVKG